MINAVGEKYQRRFVFLLLTLGILKEYNSTV